jgi:hypothetical protein
MRSNVSKMILQIYDTFKGFAVEGSEFVSKVRTFKGVVDLKNHFLYIWTHLDTFPNLRNLFGEFGKRLIFLECNPSNVIPLGHAILADHTATSISYFLGTLRQDTVTLKIKWFDHLSLSPIFLLQFSMLFYRPLIMKIFVAT